MPKLKKLVLLYRKYTIDSAGMARFNEKDYIRQLSIDCVLFAYKDLQLKVLIEKLRFKGNFWTLPGGFVKNTEDIDKAAQRILYARTGLTDIVLDQFYVFGKADRNSSVLLKKLVKLNPELQQKELDKKTIDWITQRFISIGYFGVVDLDVVSIKKNEIDATMEWRNVNDLPVLIMDHSDIILKAIEALRNNLHEKLIAFRFLPTPFTMKEIQQVYETIFAKKYIRTNFQKKILDMNVLIRLKKKYTGAANKAPYLYKLK